MKTTVEITDALLAAARETAARENTTVRALIEDGLRKVLEQRGARAAFRLRKASFRGRGLSPEAVAQSWDRLRDTTAGWPEPSRVGSGDGSAPLSRRTIPEPHRPTAPALTKHNAP